MNHPSIKLWNPPAGALGASFGPALAALRHWLARRLRSAPTVQTDHDALLELDAHTLVDIGAPDRLQARAMARREAQRHERDALHAGHASGAWHHW
jgi:hypothetical protein